MIEFPINPEQFYRFRDDRTNRYINNCAYQSVGCTVTVDPIVASSLILQTILIVTCNLLSRWCRTVTIVLPEIVHSIIPYFDTEELSSVVSHIMHDADPFSRFIISDHVVDNHSLRLHIGSGTIEDVKSATIINASGWIASINTSQGSSLPPAQDENILGAIAAACLGVAQIFKKAVGIPEELLISDGIFNLFNLQRISTGKNGFTNPKIDKFDLGKILMVGAGSVGSSTAYCLKLSDMPCKMTVIDKDVVKIENFNRSPIFGRSNFGLNKAEAVAQIFTKTPINATAFPMSWNEFIKVNGRKYNEFDIWLPLANEENVRLSIQDNIPPLLVYATTSVNWSVNHGRHIYGIDDCLADRFPQEVTENDLTCSTGNIDTPRGTVDAALPFLSFFAGLLVVAELIRLQMPNYPQIPNFACVDFGGNLTEIQKQNMKPRQSCACKSLSQSLYKTFNGTVRYSNLALSVLH